MSVLLERIAQISETLLQSDLVHANEYDLQAGIFAALEHTDIRVREDGTTE